MKDLVTRHKIEIWIFALALILRCALFSIDFSHNDRNLIGTIMGDDGYYQLSQNIIAGNGFTFDSAPPYSPNPLRPPVWPYTIAFLASTFGSYWAVFIFEIILGSLIPVLAFYLASRMFDRRVGKWVGIILALSPYSILFSFILYTETSFIFFFLISLIFLFRYVDDQSIRNVIWFGVFLGLATLIKPTVQYLPIVVPAILWIAWRKSITRDHVKQCVLFLITFLAVISPWLYRNHVEFGVWGMSAQPAFNLYVYLAPTVLSIDNGTDFKTEHRSFVKTAGFDENNISLANSSLYTSRAIDVIMDHKLALIKSGLITLVTFFTHDGMLTVFGYSGIRFENILSKPAITLLAHPIELVQTIGNYAMSPAIAIVAFRLFWVAVTIFFVFGVYRFLHREQKKVLASLIIVIIFYFAATTAINGLGVNARFRMPVETFIVGFALYGLFSLKKDNTLNPNNP
jgi:4-amino-4-deoxy-L-arabinose transferase-like glycosyltransferase